MQLVPFVAVVVSRQQVTRTESRQCTGTLVIKERADITCKRRNMVQAKKKKFDKAPAILYSGPHWIFRARRRARNISSLSVYAAKLIGSPWRFTLFANSAAVIDSTRFPAEERWGIAGGNMIISIGFLTLLTGSLFNQALLYVTELKINKDKWTPR